MGIKLNELVALTYQQIKPGNTATGLDVDVLTINYDGIMHYTSAGTTVMKKGDKVTGATSAAVAWVVGRTIEDGTDGAGTAEGLLMLERQDGTFTAAELLKIGADADVATVTANSVSVKSWRGMKAQMALMITEDQAINWLMDGGDPGQTGGTDRGMPLLAVATTADHHLIIRGYENIKRFRVIDRTASIVATVKTVLFF